MTGALYVLPDGGDASDARRCVLVGISLDRGVMQVSDEKVLN